jgi:hypothetical protein
MKAVEFTDKTRNAICRVAGECAADMTSHDARDPEIVAEVALDANRLRMFGHPEADDEVARLVNKFGFDRVRKAAAKFVPTD